MLNEKKSPEDLFGGFRISEGRESVPLEVAFQRGPFGLSQDDRWVYARNLSHDFSVVSSRHLPPDDPGDGAPVGIEDDSEDDSFVDEQGGTPTKDSGANHSRKYGHLSIALPDIFSRGQKPVTPVTPSPSGQNFPRKIPLHSASPHTLSQSPMTSAELLSTVGRTTPQFRSIADFEEMSHVSVGESPFEKLKIMDDDPSEDSAHVDSSDRVKLNTFVADLRAAFHPHRENETSIARERNNSLASTVESFGRHPSCSSACSDDGFKKSRTASDASIDSSTFELSTLPTQCFPSPISRMPSASPPAPSPISLAVRYERRPLEKIDPNIAKRSYDWNALCDTEGHILKIRSGSELTRPEDDDDPPSYPIIVPSYVFMQHQTRLNESRPDGICQSYHFERLPDDGKCDLVMMHTYCENLPDIFYAFGVCLEIVRVSECSYLPPHLMEEFLTPVVPRHKNKRHHESSESVESGSYKGESVPFPLLGDENGPPPVKKLAPSMPRRASSPMSPLPDSLTIDAPSEKSASVHSRSPRYVPPPLRENCPPLTLNESPRPNRHHQPLRSPPSSMGNHPFSASHWAPSSSISSSTSSFPSRESRRTRRRPGNRASLAERSASRKQQARADRQSNWRLPNES